jgi:hypothetical protein
VPEGEERELQGEVVGEYVPGVGQERQRPGENERSRYLIARRAAKGAGDADLLVVRLPDGRKALPVFGLEEAAGMFLWLETAGEGWRVAEFSDRRLAALLRGSCAGVQCVVRPFAADGVGRGPATVAREDFLRTLPAERSRRGEGPGHELLPVISAREEKNIW